MPLKFMKPIRAEYLSQTIKPGMGENQYGTPFTIDEAESVTSRNLSSRAFPAMQVRPGREKSLTPLTTPNGIGARDNTYPHVLDGTVWKAWNGEAWAAIKSGLTSARANFIDFSTATTKYTIMSNGTDSEAFSSTVLSHFNAVAPRYGDEETILSLCVFNNKIYGGTDIEGKLLEWNGTNAWVEKASYYAPYYQILSLAVYNNKLYGGTTGGGLLEWNGTNAWVEKAPKFGDETQIHSLCVFNNKLYGGTFRNGKLLEWNDSNAWVEKAPKLGTVTRILSMVVFNNKLYGGTYPGDLLYEWNGTNAWVAVTSSLTEDYIHSIVVFNNKIYGGTGPHGKLYEWNGTNAWVEKASLTTSSESIKCLAVFGTKLYGAITYNGIARNALLVEWDGTSKWNVVASRLGSSVYLYSLAVLGTKLYGGTGLDGRLLEWEEVTSTSITQAPLTRLIATHRGRLYALIGRELKFSALNLITDWTTVNDAGSITITNAKSDGVAIIEYADHIVVLTGNSMHELHGSGPQNYQLIDISDDGCIAERTLIENAGVLYWLDEGEFKAYTGSKPVVISQKVQSYLKEIPSAYKYKACCGKLGKYIYLSIPYGSSATENNLLLEYDTELRQWYPQTGAFVDFVTIGEKLYGVDSSGIVYDMDNGTTDAGVAITWYKETGAYLKQSLRNKKMLQNLYIAFDQPVGSTFTVGTSVTVDASDFVTRTTFTADSAEQNVKTVIDANQIGYVDWYRLKLAGTGPATVHAIEQVFRMER